MPSPLAHGVIGYAVYRSYQPGARLDRGGGSPAAARLMAAVIALSLLPDADTALGLLMGDIGAYHNRMASSLLTGAGVAFLIAFLVWTWKRAGFRVWFSLSLLCYELHVAADFFTWGGGVMLFWPLSEARFSSPVSLFYGFHWSDGLVHVRHVWTLLSEAAFGAVVFAGLGLRSRRGEDADRDDAPVARREGGNRGLHREPPP